MTSRLVGKLALVTGGSDGIGLAIAAAFAAEGASVILVGRGQAKLERASGHVGEFGGEVQVYAADLGRASMRDELVRKLFVANRGRQLDILVNNAGVSVFTPLGSVTDQEFDDQVSLNVAAPLFLTQSLLPMMRAPGASVINMSSYFSDKLLWNRPSCVYSLTKGALNSLTKAMSFELAPRGIRVNSISRYGGYCPTKKYDSHSSGRAASQASGVYSAPLSGRSHRDGARPHRDRSSSC